MSNKCVYWIDGLCHRYPPTMKDIGWCGWPLVKEDCFCGEEKRQEYMKIQKQNLTDKDLEEAMKDPAVTSLTEFTINGCLSQEEIESRKMTKKEAEEKEKKEDEEMIKCSCMTEKECYESLSKIFEQKYDSKNYPGITKEQEIEINAIFNNEEVMRCMSGYGSPSSLEKPSNQPTGNRILSTEEVNALLRGLSEPEEECQKAYESMEKFLNNPLEPKRTELDLSDAPFLYHEEEHQKSNLEMAKDEIDILLEKQSEIIHKVFSNPNNGKVHFIGDKSKSAVEHPLSKKEVIEILERFGIKPDEKNEINEYRTNQFNSLISSAIKNFGGFLN